MNGILKKLFLIAGVALVAVSCNCSQSKKTVVDMKDPMDGPVVELVTTEGVIKIKLYNATPLHRDNFLKLVNEGFYDGLRFHRVIYGFMIQGGDPLSRELSRREEWGTGGPGYTVPAEIVPELHHCKGAVAAARLGDMANPRRASSGSQFYIVQDEDGCRHLDGQYTIFGQVVEGLDVVDKIANTYIDERDCPMVSVVINSARECHPEVPADSVAVSVDSVDSGSLAPADSAKK